MQATPFATLIREHLLNRDGVIRLPQCRRFTVLFSVGDPADSVFFLDSGLAKIVRHGPESKEVLLTLIRPGETFGEEGLLLGGSRQTTAEVLQEGSISIIPRDLFVRFCEDQPQVWPLLAKMLAARQRQLEQKIEMLLMFDVEQRILFYLADLADAIGVQEAEENGGVAVQFSQGEIASLVGATRETTSSTLNSLARRGLVSLGRRRLIVSDPDALRREADSTKSRGAAGV